MALEVSERLIICVYLRTKQEIKTQNVTNIFLSSNQSRFCANSNRCQCHLFQNCTSTLQFHLSLHSHAIKQTMKWFLILLLVKSASALFWNVLGYGTGITYQLYTKLNPVNGQPLTYADLNSVYRSDFNRNNPTR